MSTLPRPQVAVKSTVLLAITAGLYFVALDATGQLLAEPKFSGPAKSLGAAGPFGIGRAALARGPDDEQSIAILVDSLAQSDIGHRRAARTAAHERIDRWRLMDPVAGSTNVWRLIGALKEKISCDGSPHFRGVAAELSGRLLQLPIVEHPTAKDWQNECLQIITAAHPGLVSERPPQRSDELPSSADEVHFEDLFALPGGDSTTPRARP